MRERLPDQLITTCYGITPYLDMGCWPEESQVAHSHVYVYGVLDGPIGQAIADFAVGKAIDLGYWGVVLGSNCAPHHPGWANLAWQRALNDRFLSGGNAHLGAFLT